MQREKIKYSISQNKKSDPGNRTLRITWDAGIPDQEFDFCIGRTKSLIEAFPAKTLLIDSSNLQETALLLDWRIIESSWKEFYSNGGEIIIVFNKSKQPEYIKREYIENMDKYGIPLKLIFREGTNYLLN